MIEMDRQKAFAVLGLPDDASREEIDALVSERRRKLRQRIVFATTAAQRESSERALSELETAHAVATLAPTDPDGHPPSGVAIDLACGQTIGDRYVIRRRIGYGENGAVFAALDLSWGKEIAVKILRPELLLVPGTYDRLQECVQNVFDLAHSGVISVYGLSKMDGHVVVPMELLPDRTLRTVVQETPGPQAGIRRMGLSLPHAAEIVHDICAALDYARSRTVHLNLKPDNVFVTDDGFVKLTDFGLGPVLGPALKVTSPTAREQQRYRAPEVARQSETGTSGSAPVDERADQFSVAAIAHYLMFATAPYPDPSVMALRHRGASKAMAEVLSRALSSEPRERFATVADFAAAFEKAAKLKPVRRVALTTTAGVVLLIAAFASVMLWSTPQSSDPSLFARIVRLLPGADSAPPISSAILERQDRVLELSRTLLEEQNALRRSVIESRIDVRAKAQAVELAEDNVVLSEAESTFEAADDEYRQLMALRDIANPDIFNSPDTLNAINLIGLASDHIEGSRYAAAKEALERAETVLTEKLRDYKQAQDMVAERFDPAAEDPSPLQALSTPADLRRDWLQASQSRRRFAAQVQEKMVTVDGGSFQMGDIAGVGNQTERPIRTVLVPAFQISAFEVTHAEYAACVAENACSALNGTLAAEAQTPANMPVTGVSWFDAQSYLAWISLKTGEDYRLPTEAEWEFAARSGLNSVYPWGEIIGRGRANCVNCGSAWEGIGAAPVGSFAPNGYGLYDMAGNAWEWTADCWYGDYTGAPAIAIAREGNALCAERTLRGGSWANDAFLARTTYRGRARADTRQDIYGFRIARSVD